MKALGIGIAAFALLSTASAAKNPQDELCEAVSAAAEAIMTRRQSGVSMVTQIKKAEDMPVAAQDLARQLITQAYATPRYSTPVMQQRSIEDFRDMAAAACYK